MTQTMAKANEALQGAQQHHQGGNNEFRVLGRFQKNNPLTFKGRYDPEGAKIWLKEIEKIYKMMVCTDA